MLMLPLYKIMNGLGLSGSHFGVIIGHLTVTLPFSVWLLVSFFKKLPREIDEAAVMDGANEWQVFAQDRSAPVHLRRAQHGDHGIYYVMERVFALQRADQ